MQKSKHEEYVQDMRNIRKETYAKNTLDSASEY